LVLKNYIFRLLVFIISPLIFPILMSLLSFLIIPIILILIIPIILLIIITITIIIRFLLLICYLVIIHFEYFLIIIGFNQNSNLRFNYSNLLILLYFLISLIIKDFRWHLLNTRILLISINLVFLTYFLQEHLLLTIIWHTLRILVHHLFQWELKLKLLIIQFEWMFL